MLTFWLTGLFAFTVGAVYDALNVGFMHASEKGRPIRAGVFSVLVGLAAFVGFREAIEDIWMLPFLLSGYFVGTYWAVRAKDKPHRSAREMRETRLKKLGFEPHLPASFLEKYDRYLSGHITYEQLHDRDHK